MSSRRLLPVLAALALVAPCAASAAVPVSMYPFRVPGLSAAQRGDLHAVLEAALVTAARRGTLSPRMPALLAATCGETPTPACLAEAAGKGVVLAGRGELKGGVVLVTAALWDAKGARTREVRFVVDLVIQNMRPVGDAIAELEVEIELDGTVARSGQQPPAARDPHGPRTAGVAGADPPPEAAAPPPAPPPAPSGEPPPGAKPAAAKATPTKLAVGQPARPPPLWKRQAGPLFTGVGAALLAGGAVVGMKNRQLADELAAKRAAGTLSASDRASFDRVHRYNLLSSALFAAGGVAAAAGAWIWISAPARPGEPAMAGAGGRF